MILLEREINSRRFILIKNSLVEEEVEAIVNPANENLIHGGGVAGLISKIGGNAIQRESNLKAPVKTGQATHTTAGDLNYKYIIHTVGPVWKGGEQNEAGLLRSAVREALSLSDRLKIKTISMPAVSTGIFGYPLRPAINIIVKTIFDFLNQQTGLEEIHLCEFSEEKAEEIKNVIIEEVLNPDL